MRDFIMKWKVVIIWAIAIVFTAGIIWMGVASYIDMGGNNNQQADALNEYTPNRTEAVAVITEDSTDLNYAYWVMPRELSERISEINNYYRNYGQDIDELFQAPYIELNTAKSLIDNNIVKYYADQNGLSPTQEQVDAQVETLIAQNINTDEIKQSVVQRYGSLDNYKAYVRPYLEEQLKIDNVKNQVTQITQEDMKAYFEENKETLMLEGNQVKASHILVDELELAQDILAQINDGEMTFSEAAVKYSTDKSNSESGGELGWFSKGKMVAPFENAAFNADAGSIVGPVETQFGYHLINVEDKKGLETFEDFVKNEEEYNSAKTQLENQEYTNWLEGYKQENNFGYVLNDDVLNVYDKYEELTNSGEDTKNEVLSEFITWLERYIIVEEDSLRKLDPDVDPRNIALYVSTKELINDNLKNQKRILENFQETADKVEQVYKSMSVEQLESLKAIKDDEIKSLEDEIVTIEEEMARLGQATDTQANENEAFLNTLNDKLTLKKTSMNELESDTKNVETAIEYHELVKGLAQENIEPSNVVDVLADIDAEVQTNESRIVEGLNILYNTNTTSKQVVNLLRKYEPDNSEIALKWFQSQIDQYTMYMNDKEIFNQYRVILEPQLLQYQMGIMKIARSDEEPIARRVAAYETLLNLIEKWGKYEEEVEYLEELKELKPDYPDIDLIIEQVKETVEIQKAEEAAALTQTATQSEATQ